MKSEYMAEFDQFSVDLDHSEATAINATFDTIKGLTGDNLPLTTAQILDQAITTVNEASVDVVDGKTTNFETFKGSARWVAYRYAYLRDLEPAYEDLDLQLDDFEWSRDGLEPEFESYAKKFEFLLDSQIRADELSDAANPAATTTFAALDRERVRRERSGEIMLDPLGLEKQYTLKTLLNTLDAVVEGPDSTPDDNSYDELRSVHVAAANHPNYQPVERTIVRTKTDFENIYSVNLFRSKSIDENGLPRIDIEYYIVESEEGITIEGRTLHGELVIEPYTALEIASSVSRDQRFVAERADFEAVTPSRWTAAAARIINRLGDATENFLQTVRPMYVGEEQGPSEKI